MTEPTSGIVIGIWQTKTVAEWGYHRISWGWYSEGWPQTWLGEVIGNACDEGGFPFHGSYVNFDSEDPQYAKNSRISELILKHPFFSLRNWEFVSTLWDNTGWSSLSNSKKKKTFWDLPHFRKNQIEWKSVGNIVVPKCLPEDCWFLADLCCHPQKIEFAEGLAFHLWKYGIFHQEKSGISLDFTSKIMVTTFSNDGDTPGLPWVLGGRAQKEGWDTTLRAWGGWAAKRLGFPWGLKHGGTPSSLDAL